jgi:hypothetical protein
MGEVTLELIYKHMQAGQAEIKAELAAVRAEQEATSAKIGTLAASMVSMRRQIRRGIAQRYR